MAWLSVQDDLRISPAWSVPDVLQVSRRFYPLRVFLSPGRSFPKFEGRVTVAHVIGCYVISAPSRYGLTFLPWFHPWITLFKTTLKNEIGVLCQSFA
jgi:hypothetical protein